MLSHWSKRNAIGTKGKRKKNKDKNHIVANAHGAELMVVEITV